MRLVKLNDEYVNPEHVVRVWTDDRAPGYTFITFVGGQFVAPCLKVEAPIDHVLYMLG